MRGDQLNVIIGNNAYFVKGGILEFGFANQIDQEVTEDGDSFGMAAVFGIDEIHVYRSDFCVGEYGHDVGEAVGHKMGENTDTRARAYSLANSRN